ncbi:hypothetical protein PG984_008554 [Apiospora sp. TS-2023a]
MGRGSVLLSLAGSGVVSSGLVLSVGVVLSGSVIGLRIVLVGILLIGGVVSLGIILLGVVCVLVLSGSISITREQGLALGLSLLEVELLGLEGQVATLAAQMFLYPKNVQSVKLWAPNGMEQERKEGTGGEEAYLLDGLDSTLEDLRLIGCESEDDLLVEEVGNVLDLDQAEDLELLERLELQQQVDGLSDVQVEVGDLLGVDVADTQEEHLLENVLVQAVLQVGIVEGGARALEDLGTIDIRGNLSVLDLLSQLVEGFLGRGLGVSLSIGIGRGLVCSSAWGRGLVRIGGLISRCAEGLVIDGSRESRVDRESQGGEDGGVDELHFDGSVE